LIQTVVGSEESKDNELIDNIKFVYNNIIHHLPLEENNIKSAYLKFTMGKPIRVV